MTNFLWAARGIQIREYASKKSSFWFVGKISSTQTHCSLYFVYDIRSGIKFLRKKVGLLAEGPGIQKNETFCKGALLYILHLHFQKMQSCAKKYIEFHFF